MTEKNNVTVYIVFPVHNRIEETKKFLASLARQTVTNYRLVICDDGSTDGTGEYLAKNCPDVVIVKGTGQLWWTAGINRCIEYVLSCCDQNDYVLTLNNDVSLPPEYLQQKLARAKDNPDAIIGSLCVYADNTDIIETSGYIINYDKCSSDRLTKPGELRNEQHKGLAEVTHLPGKGVLLPVKLFREVGLYDEVGLPQYHADTDLVLRAHDMGYRVYVDFDSVVLSEINTNNMVLPTQEITLKGIVKTFIGPYSMNNFRVYNNFARKHFPGKRLKFLAIIYVKTISGLAKRYIKYKLGTGGGSTRGSAEKPGN
mgnify:CR=1 FL=1